MRGQSDVARLIERLRDRTRTCNACYALFRTRNKSDIESTGSAFDQHATSGQLAIRCVRPKGCPSNCVERTGAFQALCSPDLYDAWHLYQDRILCFARSSYGFTPSLGGWILWLRKTNRLQSSNEYNPELFHLAWSRGCGLGTSL